MGRAEGKHPRRGQDLFSAALPAEGELTAGEEAELGIGEERDIPGGLNHVSNPAVRRQAVPVPERQWPYDKSLLAHGVDPREHGINDREVHGQPRTVLGGTETLHGPEEQPSPVPVYVVELAGGRRAKATAAFRRITLPVAGSEPVTIVPASESRVIIQVINEDQAHNGRIGNLEDLSYDYQNSQYSGGARVPAAATGYTVFRSKDQIYGVSETNNTVVISVIMEDEIAGAL